MSQGAADEDTISGIIDTRETEILEEYPSARAYRFEDTNLRCHFFISRSKVACMIDFTNIRKR